MKIAFLAALLLGIGSAAGAQEAPPAREASAPLTLRKCLEIGLEQNYDVRIVRNEERVSDNNATAGNAGMLPTVDLSAGYTGTLDNDRTVTPRNGDATTETGVYDQTANVGLAVNWTLFDGLRIRTNYKRLKEMQQMGALKTRITIEDFMASLTAEYYNYIQQTLRLENFRYAVSLSRERLRITEACVQVGNFSRLDLLQARVDFNADSSKYMSQHELVTASRIRINELLANENLDERFSIPDSVIRVNATLDWNDLLLGEEVRRVHQRLHAADHGVHKGHSAAQHGQTENGIAVADELQLLDLLDQPLLGADDDGLLFRSAHEDALNERLTADGGAEFGFCLVLLCHVGFSLQ